MRILGRTRDWLRYDVPDQWLRREWRGNYRGQKQIWFLLRLVGRDCDVSLRASRKPEFDAWRWSEYWVPMESVIEFKREVYQKALQELAPLPRRRARSAGRGSAPRKDLAERRRSHRARLTASPCSGTTLRSNSSCCSRALPTARPTQTLPEGSRWTIPRVQVMTDFQSVTAIIILPADTVDEAHRRMIQRGVRLLLVVDQNRNVLGVITATDILGEKPVQVAVQRGFRRGEIQVRDIMTPAGAPRGAGHGRRARRQGRTHRGDAAARRAGSTRWWWSATGRAGRRCAGSSPPRRSRGSSA